MSQITIRVKNQVSKKKTHTHSCNQQTHIFFTEFAGGLLQGQDGYCHGQSFQSVRQKVSLRRRLFVSNIFTHKHVTFITGPVFKSMS